MAFPGSIDYKKFLSLFRVSCLKRKLKINIYDTQRSFNYVATFMKTFSKRKTERKQVYRLFILWELKFQ